MRLRSLSELEVTGRTVLVRTTFNVPLKNGKIGDDFRIKSSLLTINYLFKKNAKVIMISHLGRPKGWDEAFSLLTVAHRLAEILDRKLVVVPKEVKKLPEYDIPHLYFFPHNLEQEDLAVLTAQMQERDAAVLENLRFYPGEQKNDHEFARKLATLGEAYVNEAFADSHRADTSISLVPKLLPAAAGFHFLKEVEALERVLRHPLKPIVVMLGGVKLSDKARALENLAKIADFILLGGGLANLFLKIRGYQIGKSVSEEKNESELVKQILRDYQEKIKLPVDVVVSRSREGEAEVVKIEKVKGDQMILDIGPLTILQYSSYLKKGRTLVWGGPMGYFEKRSFSHGTFALARLFAGRTKRSAFGVAGGGETLEIISKLGLAQYIDHVSTGGGAMLEYLAGKSLPGIEAIMHD